MKKYLFKRAQSAVSLITAVSTNFLIDPNRVIIAKNLRGAELEKKLNDLIKK